MKKIKLVSVGASETHQNQMGFDWRSDLENRLMNIRSESNASDLVSDVNEILQTSENLTFDEKLNLKNIRQRAYDRKKKFQLIKNSKIKTDPDDLKKIQNIRSKNHNLTPTVSSEGFNGHQKYQKSDDAIFSKEFLTEGTSANHQKNSSEQILNYFKNIDFENILNKLPALVLFSLCAAITMWFVWRQSIPLYESTGFSEPKWCAFGALLMIAGFSVIHAMTRSKIVLLLCLYASSYEVVLIVNGTVKNETQISQIQINENKEVVWLKQQAEHSNQSYQTVKAQYENPSSKVFQNNWYKDKFVDVAWQKYSKDQKELSDKIEKLSVVNSDWDRVGMLKILYRLGLVFLCMISIHHLLKLFQFSKKNQNTPLRPQTLSGC